MNEKIQKLWEQASIRYSVWETLKPQDERKTIPDIFSELIVKKCAEICLEANDHKNILRYFGVEE